MINYRKIIDDANRELVDMHGGSMDAYYDTEWAKEEGIPVIEFSKEQLEELILSIDISRLTPTELYELSLKLN